MTIAGFSCTMQSALLNLALLTLLEWLCYPLGETTTAAHLTKFRNNNNIFIFVIGNA